MEENMDFLVKRLTEAAELHGGFIRIRNELITNGAQEVIIPIKSLEGTKADETTVDDTLSSDAKVYECYKEELKENMQLQRRTNDLLELMRLQNKEYQIEKSRLNLTDVLQDAVHSMRKIAASKEVDIDLNGELSSHKFVGDYGRLRQMFICVIENGIRHSRHGQAVQVRIEKGEEAFRIIIEDHGGGMEPSMMEHIFDHFQKRESAPVLTEKGLGLTIAKQIAVRHGIEIQVASELDVGSQFTFVL